MSLRRNAITLSAALVITACGGGGDEGSNIPLPGGAETAEGNACDNDYYRELIGTYRGQAIYDVGAVEPTSVTYCAWTMTVRIEPETTLFQCQLRMVTSSELEQGTVLPGDDDDAYQCVEENGVRTLYEPNQSTDQTTFANVRFPVNASYELQADVPRSGPYFGDDAFIVRNIYLLDGTGAIGDILQFDGEGALRILPGGQDLGFLNATLVKE